MNAFSKAISEGLKAIANVAGEEITFHRGDDFAVIIAVEGRSDFQSTDPHGSVIDFRTIDFIVATEDLVVGDAAITPDDGDYITRTSGNTLQTYRIRRPDNGRLYGYSDATQTRMRIHTELSGESNL